MNGSRLQSVRFFLTKTLCTSLSLLMCAVSVSGCQKPQASHGHSKNDIFYTEERAAVIDKMSDQDRSDWVRYIVTEANRRAEIEELEKRPTYAHAKVWPWLASTWTSLGGWGFLARAGFLSAVIGTATLKANDFRQETQKVFSGQKDVLEYIFRQDTEIGREVTRQTGVLANDTIARVKAINENAGQDGSHLARNILEQSTRKFSGILESAWSFYARFVQFRPLCQRVPRAISYPLQDYNAGIAHRRSILNTYDLAAMISEARKGIDTIAGEVDRLSSDLAEEPVVRPNWHAFTGTARAQYCLTVAKQSYAVTAVAHNGNPAYVSQIAKNQCEHAAVFLALTATEMIEDLSDPNPKECNFIQFRPGCQPCGSQTPPQQQHTTAGLHLSAGIASSDALRTLTANAIAASLSSARSDHDDREESSSRSEATTPTEETIATTVGGTGNTSQSSTGDDSTTNAATSQTTDSNFVQAIAVQQKGEEGSNQPDTEKTILVQKPSPNDKTPLPEQLNPGKTTTEKAKGTACADNADVLTEFVAQTHFQATSPNKPWDTFTKAVEGNEDQFCDELVKQLKSKGIIGNAVPWQQTVGGKKQRLCRFKYGHAQEAVNWIQRAQQGGNAFYVHALRPLWNFGNSTFGGGQNQIPKPTPTAHLEVCVRPDWIQGHDCFGYQFDLDRGKTTDSASGTRPVHASLVYHDCPNVTDAK